MRRVQSPYPRRRRRAVVGAVAGRPPPRTIPVLPNGPAPPPRLYVFRRETANRGDELHSFRSVARIVAARIVAPVVAVGEVGVRPDLDEVAVRVAAGEVDGAPVGHADHGRQLVEADAAAQDEHVRGEADAADLISGGGVCGGNGRGGGRGGGEGQGEEEGRGEEQRGGHGLGNASRCCST